MATHSKTEEIRAFILKTIRAHPRDIGSVAAAKFEISSRAVRYHLQSLVDESLLNTSGKTSAKLYELAWLDDFHVDLPINQLLEEHAVWTECLKPRLSGVVPKNTYEIAEYAFGEMLNNAIDHSEGSVATVRFVRTAATIKLVIEDSGVGIFKKVKDACNLPEEHDAIFELSKGKFTTDPTRHSGEGIYFTSRMCDDFAIYSGRLAFTHIRRIGDWISEELDDRERGDWISEEAGESVDGTAVVMEISTTTELRIAELYEEFASSESDNDHSFSKTHVPIKLAQYGDGSLVSRSQAKRLLSRFEKFKTVVLDFTDVPFIGQAFADQIFRVFQNEHPEIELIPTNTSPLVEGVIRRVQPTE